MSNVLIQIGFPKTGSTYLQEWFKAHPSIMYGGKSILGFYDSWEIERYVQQATYFQYHTIKLSAIGLRGNVHQMIQSDFANNQIDVYQSRLAEAMYRLFPTAKVLIVTRGFKSMLASLYTEYIVTGGTAPFSAFFEQYKPGILKAYNYDNLVRCFQTVYGEENVIVLPFELLQDDPNKFIQSIERALQIENSIQFATSKVNASPSKKYLYANLRLSNFVYKSIRFFPLSAQRRLYGFYARLLNKRKNHFLIQKLALLLKKEIEVEVTNQMLEPFQSNALVLKERMAFNNYLKEYLLM